MRRRGHPLHPLLTDFPIVLWTVGALLDAAAAWFGRASWWSLAYWAVAAGLVGAIPALITGLWDFARLKDPSAAVRAAVVHMVLMLTATGLFGLSLLLRPGPGTAPATPLPAALSWLGLLTLIAGGWFGGELVFRYGIGVDREAPGG